MKKLLLIALILLIQGCSSIPLSTMWKMKSFDHKDFAQLTPQYIRTKIRTDKYVDVDAKSLRLSVQYMENNQAQEKEFALEPVESGETTIERWFGADDIEYYTSLRLTKESIKAFQSLQKSQLITQKSDAIQGITVIFGFGENEPESYIMSVDLLLNPEDGYFTLFDELPFGIDNIQKYAEESSE